MTQLLQGNCLIESDKIKDESVDLILTDLPYGNMNTDGGIKIGIIGWDTCINPTDIFKLSDRTLREGGRLILFSQDPYTTELISNQIPNLPYNYRAQWVKDTPGNILGVNKNMVGLTEDILIFTKKEGYSRNKAKDYTDKIRSFINLPNKKIFEDFHKSGLNKYAVLDTFNSSNARRYNFPTEKTYKALDKLYGISSMSGFLEYREAKEISLKQGSVFNLWEKNKYKSNVLQYKKDRDGFHPTQKPVLLLEDLIKTFSNEGDLVVDLTMGSGSTGVASVNTNRNFIGIEMDKKFFQIAAKRINI